MRTMMGKRSQVVVSIILIANLIIACPSFTKNAYKTLDIAATTYETTMDIAKDAYYQGLISEERKDQIKSVSRKYHTIYHAAADALVAYKKGEMIKETINGLEIDRDPQEVVNEKLAELKSITAELEQIKSELGGAK